MALDGGWIQPQTEMQRRFVDCCNGELRADTVFEKLWIRYRKSVRDELAERKGRDEADAELRHQESGLLERLQHAHDTPEQEIDRISRALQKLEDYRRWTEKVRDL